LIFRYLLPAAASQPITNDALAIGSNCMVLHRGVRGIEVNALPGGGSNSGAECSECRRRGRFLG
jgi:hypothetical protein